MRRKKSEGQEVLYQQSEGPSPVTKRIMNRLPIETIFDEIQKIISLDYRTGKQIYTAIREFFYVAYRRDTGTRDNSILTTLDRELRTGKRIRGLDHKIKAACTYKCVAKALDKISGLLETEIEYKEVLIQFQLYLTTLKSRLGRELIKITDTEKREEIKIKVKLDLDLIIVDHIASPHKRALETFHKSPQKNTDGSTPKRIRKKRRQGQWKMALFMDEEKGRRKADKLPKLTVDLFGGQEIGVLERGPNTGLSPWVVSSDSDLSLPKAPPLITNPNRHKISFEMKQKGGAIPKDQHGKPFNLFAAPDKEAERGRELEKIASSSGLELGHNTF